MPGKSEKTVVIRHTNERDMMRAHIEEHHAKYDNPSEKFIQTAIKRPGQLHRDLGVPQGEKIPQKKIQAAASGKYGKKVAQRARFAKTLKKLHK